MANKSSKWLSRRSIRAGASHREPAPFTWNVLYPGWKHPYTELAMRQCLVWTVVLMMAWSQTLWPATNSWNKIRYMGGTTQANVNPYDWNTILTVTPDAIVFVLGHRQTIRIPPAQVTTL